MNHLHVWLTLPSGETVPLGELVFGAPRTDGTAPSAFRYAAAWLTRPDAFALNPDPQSLPLDGREFQASHLGPPLQVIDDALPDDWGRRLIIAEQKLPMARQTPYEIMLAVAGNGLGALSFSERKQPPPRPDDQFDLAELMQAAADFEAGRPVEDARLHRLCAAGGSPGGARPKARITWQGQSWIAKFPSQARDNGHDVVGLEATCLTLAAQAGLVVPAIHLADLGSRRVLLVRRFDIAPNRDQSGRHHMITLKTLCREGAGLYALSYDAPAEAIRKYSDDPDDIERFFRQMVFNAAIGNTDDHLKNFLLLRDTHGCRGWRLSPAFDLVPDIGRNREHTLAIGYSHETPSRDDLVAVGQRWMGNASQARRIVQEVVDAVNTFGATAEQLAVTPDSIAFFAGDIARRIKRLA
jgi:serine/threonine-protein kinase HipA